MQLAEFDKFADEYEAMHARNIAITGESTQFFAKYKIADVRKWASEFHLSASTILDFGSGTGNSIPYWKNYFPTSRLLCSDVSQKSLDVAGQRFGGGYEAVLIDGQTIPLADGSCDLAFTACVFHHIDHGEHQHWLGEIRRVTKPGGMFVLFEHNPLNPLTVRAVNTCPFDENAHLIKAGIMRQRALAAGWSDVEVRYRIFFPGALAALRRFEPALRGIPFGAQYALIAHRAAS